MPTARARGRGRRVASALAEINVVPLVDVMLVLLIIFMVTAPMIQRGIDVNLPVARRASAIEGERVFVTVPAAYPAEPSSCFSNEEADPRRRAAGAGPAEVGDAHRQAGLSARRRRVLYQDLMDVFDRLKQLASNVGIARIAGRRDEALARALPGGSKRPLRREDA